MAFIETTPPDKTSGPARDMLERQQRHFGFVPNYAKLYTDRVDVMERWAALQVGIRSHVMDRRFELITFVAARTMANSYCTLAHGRILEERHLGPEEMVALAQGDYSLLSEVEAAVLRFAEKVVRDSSSITSEDVEVLRAAGLEENEIFDVVAVAAARCFFGKLADALGALPDASYRDGDPLLNELLTVGRPIDEAEPVLIESLGLDQ